MGELELNLNLELPAGTDAVTGLEGIDLQQLLNTERLQ